MGEQEQALVAEIMSDAKKRAERMRERAAADARKIVADAQKEAEQVRRRALEEAGQRAARRRDLNRAYMQQDVAKLRLQWRQALMDRVRAEVESRLAQVAAGPEHRRALRRLALAAIKAMTGERFQLVLRPQDRRSCGEELAAEVRSAASEELGRNIEVELAQEELNANGGLMVKGAGGHEVADQTFEGRFRRLWERMRGEVAEMLPDLSGASE